MNLVDTYKHQGLRKNLVEHLRHKGIVDEKILEAIGKVPRHFFMDSAFLSFAYEDNAFPIGAEQTISQPYTVAFQTALLEVAAGMRILEIGTGSGYQTAVLNCLGCKVYSIERQKTLHKKAKSMLANFNSVAKLFYGDGYKGIPAFAPFDRILVTCGAPEMPQALLPQLKTGGIIVIPVDEGESQQMIRIKKLPDGQMFQSRHGDFKFVPMIKDKQIGAN